MERIVTKWGRSWRKTRRKLSRVLVRSEPLPTDGCTGVGRLTCYQSNELGTDFLGSWVLWFVWKFALWAKPEDIWFGTAVETFPCLGSWASQFLSSNSPWEFNLSVSHPSPGSRFPGGDPPQSRHQGSLWAQLVSRIFCRTKGFQDFEYLSVLEQTFQPLPCVLLSIIHLIS